MIQRHRPTALQWGYKITHRFRGCEDRPCSVYCLDCPTDLLVPRRLGVYLQELIRRGPPSQPFDVSV